MLTLIAKVKLPDERVLMIRETKPGWVISAEKRVGDEWVLIGDRWEEHLQDIPRYVSDYTPEEPTWVMEGAGNIVSLANFVSDYIARLNDS